MSESTEDTSEESRPDSIILQNDLFNQYEAYIQEMLVANFTLTEDLVNETLYNAAGIIPPLYR